MTVTDVSETSAAGETTELNFADAFDYAGLASLNQQYGASETVTWGPAVLGSDLTGVVTISPASGSGTLSATGPIVDIEVAPNAVTGDTFSIPATETLTESGISVTDDFSFDYTIVAGSNSPGTTPELDGIPTVPTNAQMQQTSPGVVQSGDYHSNSDGSWDIDNRTASAGDDPTYYSGANYASLITAAANTVVQGLATQVSNALQSAGQSIANVTTDFTQLSSNPLIPTLKTYLNNILNDTMGALNAVATNDLTDPSESQLLQTGAQLAANLGPDTVKFESQAQQNFEETGQSLAANELAALKAETQYAVNGSYDDEVGNSVSVAFVDPGTVISAGTTAGIIDGGAGNNTIVLNGGLDFVYTNAGNDTIEMSATTSPSFIYGGNGFETVVLSGNRSSFSVVRSGLTTTVTGPDGTDTLTSVNLLKFTDRTMALPAAPDDYFAAGNSDLLFQNASGTYAVWETNGAAVIGGGNVGSPGTGWTFEDAGFFSGDTSDILFENTNGSYALWDMSGAAVSSVSTFGSPGSGWTFKGIGDFNGDAFADILFENTAGSYAVWETNGTSVTGGGNAGSPGSGWTFQGIGDFNGDGKSDILFESTAGSFAVWEMNGTSVSTVVTFGSPGSGWSFKGIGDFNGDGFADILFENTAGSYAIWETNGAAVIGGGNAGSPGAGWSFAGIGDFNGDGKSDILFQNTAGAYAAWEMNGTAVATVATFGNPGAGWTLQHTA
jgi:hypothetical protein